MLQQGARMNLSTKIKSKNTRKPQTIKDELNYEKRLQDLESLGKTLDIHNSESILYYYKWSTAMIETADAQYANNELENAFISYLKFLDTFHNKLKHHVNYKRVPLSEKSTNQFYQRHARLRVKELRQRLLDRYKELASTYKKEIGTSSPWPLHRPVKAVSKMNFFQAKSVSHTNAIDRTALDIEACRSLRTVVVPKQLPTVFQVITKKDSDLVMWAALAGKLENNEYVVTHLIIPRSQDQETSAYCADSCDAYAERKELRILGWIHIHRVSSCFMSSVDLHAQWWYQSRLPEAIAIVCSPIWTQVKTYMLLKHGLEYLGHCTKRDKHGHESTKPLYTIARHVKVVYHLQFELVHLDEEQEGAVLG